MARLAPIAHLGLVAEDDDLLAAGVLDDFGTHDGAIDGWSTDPGLGAIASDEQHTTEVERLAGFTRQALDRDRIAGPDPVLLSPRLDNGVHSVLRPGISV